MQNDQQSAQPQQNHTENPQQPLPQSQPTGDYYKTLREGKRDFDPKTANALLMQVNMESAVKDKAKMEGMKHVGVLEALFMPWRLFDPQTPQSTRRTVIILIVLILLALAGYLVPSLIK